MRCVVSTLVMTLLQPFALAAPHPVPKADPMPERARWCLQGPSATPVPFHGLDESEASRIGPNSMMYPIAAPGLAGAITSLAAGIAAHGAVLSSMESKQARDRAARADQVLAPYRSVLGTFTTDRLFSALVASHTDWSECSEPGEAGTWLVEFGAEFLLTQDETNVSVWATPMVDAA